MVALEPRPWHRVWPSGVPKTLREEFKPIYKAVWEAGSPGRCSLVQAETLYCYTNEMLRRVSQGVAAWLQSRGAWRGAQVVFSTRNTIEAIAALIGALASGARVVLVDPLTIGEDLRMQLDGREFTALIADREFLERNSSVIEEVGIKEVLLVDSVEGANSSLKITPITGVLGLDAWRDPEVEEGDDSIALYYSGIAGRTMQAIHHHRGLYLSTLAFALMARLDDRDSSLMVPSMTHILGLQLSLLSPLIAGGTVVAMKRWNLDLALNIIRRGMITYIAGAPLMHEQLATNSSTAVRGKIRLGVSAGAPLKPEVQDLYRDRLGAPLVQAYGMTESLILTLQPPELSNIKGTLGIPLPGVDAKIVDPADPGVELGPGGTGELLVKAPWVMKGYEYPEENSKAFIDGWLRTGDIIYMDDNGLLYFKGVRKRLIKYKAYAILPRDLEVILESHPAVAKAVVEGEPDEEVGQKPIARVWLRQGSSVSPEELMEYVNSRVAFYKKLRKIIIEGYM
ncbi:MAG: acyl--CoA ligase [Desulfurococcales archaeon]|nr:acyl--CoA ligase [Desulfurococcales archaeon]